MKRFMLTAAAKLEDLADAIDAGLLVLASLAAWGLVLAATCAPGCAPLAPGAAAGIEGAVAALCPAEALIPGVGPELAAACPGEEAALAGALSAAESPPTTSPAKPARVLVYRPGKPGEPPLVHVGSVTATRWAAVERALLAATPSIDAGAPKLVADAGSEGGR